MNQPTGFWYSVGHAFYKFFGCLEWTYENMTPNKIFIVLGFVCFAWWMKMQSDFNKKAIKEGKQK